jgi:predicted MFS family arabinose efflux permease
MALHLLLAFANFSVGMAAFGVIGVLPPVAAAFGIAIADAGWLMTVYALVYAVASPLLVMMTGRIDRARVLLVALGTLYLLCSGV